MSDTLQTEALKLELGEDFDDFYKWTTYFVEGLLNEPWWGNRNQLLTNEGPVSRMVEHCLLYVIENEKQRLPGYQAYTKYLVREYGTKAPAYRLHESLTGLDTRAAETLSVRDPFEVAQLNKNKVGQDISWLTVEQQDMLYMYSQMGVRETAAVTGMSLEDAWTKYRTLRRKVRRKMGHP